MAQFYATVQGNRGEASRTGSKNSGISGHVRGWNIGVRVKMRHEDGRDVAYVYRTNGSNGYISSELIARIEEGDPNGQ